MLQIKKDVDLKILEDYGFKKVSCERFWGTEYYYSYSDDILTVDESSRYIYLNSQGWVCIPEILEVVYDLIQAGFVEKKEDD